MSYFHDDDGHCAGTRAARDAGGIAFLPRRVRSHHIRLLADCAMAKSFEAGEYLFRQGDFATRFYLIEQGMVILEALDSAGTCVVVEEVGARNWWAGHGFSRPTSGISTRARPSRPARSFSTAQFCGNTRQGSIVRLRAFQKDEPGDGQASAVCARASIQQPFQPGENEKPGETAAVRRGTARLEGYVPPAARVSTGENDRPPSGALCLTKIHLANGDPVPVK